MANITRFDPFSELTSFDPFGDFNQMMKWFRLRPSFPTLEMEPQIKLDVTEDDKAYTIKAEIPGVKKEDIKVSADGNYVTIAAEVQKERETKEGKKVLRSERYYGHVSRSFTLEQDVDAGAAKAKYADGILELVLPKKVGGASKQISVS
jgi:HSP20 family protein